MVYLMIQNNCKRGLFGRSLWSDPMPSQRTLDDHDQPTARVPSSPAPLTKPEITATVTAGPGPSGGRLLDRLSSAERKEYPMFEGLLGYFPDACAEVAHVSFLGNQKHNPGQPLHWSRDKSADHADCVIRHYTTRGGMDGKVQHLAEAAWRALADLQIALEDQHRLSPPKNAK